MRRSAIQLIPDSEPDLAVTPERVAGDKGDAPAASGGQLTFRLGLVMGVLCAATLVVVLASAVQDVLIFLMPETGFNERIYRLDLDTEASLPTWFSSSLMLLCALALLFIALQARREDPWKAAPWMILTVVFCALSLDEVAAVHEWLSAALSARFDNTGLFYFAWTLPALVVCLAGLACFIPFILGFGGFDRILLIGSAFVFLSGAIGMEMLGGAEAEAGGIETLRYRMLATIEESLEYAGLLLFLLFLLRQMRCRYNRTTFCLE